MQSKSFTAASSGSFSSNVTAGNSVVLVQFAYTNATSTTISTSSPTFNGGSVSGASKLMEQQSAMTVASVYGAAWLLPNLAGGAASVGLTVTNGTVDSNVGMVGYEISGLGASPQLDSGASPNPAETAGNSTNPASGSTGALTQSQEILFGMAVEYGVAVTGPSSPWANLAPSSLCAAGYQVVSTAGGFAYNTTSGSVQRWIAGICAVRATPATPGSTLLKATFP